ncbi:MAG: 50S ribosomal protein L5 [Nitrososphaerota archaeon]|nr:50S ribosomal protein L5 [Nitrososphaerota archaeon]
MSEEAQNKWTEHKMLQPRIEKVVVNLNIGKSGEPLERATRVLEEISGQMPYKAKAKKSIRDWGVRQGEPIACVVTLRREKGLDFLKKVLPVVDNKISKRAFDEIGNFAFGLKEHIDIPGVKYDPEIGIFGMDICVSVNRPGQRIKIRRKQTKHIGKTHRLTPEESMEYVRQTLGVEIV